MSQPDPVTFGRYIADARKKLQMSQKELASQILREEDDEPISPQYLNDLEHNRRNPPGPQMLKQFADVLGLDYDVLFFAAGQYPEDVQGEPHSPERVQAAFQAFRRELRKP